MYMCESNIQTYEKSMKHDFYCVSRQIYDKFISYRKNYQWFYGRILGLVLSSIFKCQ